MAPMSYRTRKRKQSKPSKSYSSSSYSSSTIGSDQISNLPESILEHILLYLPVDDAISLSSVSKTLLRAWNSLPALDFHFDVANIADEYNLQQVVNSIDESLSTLKESKAIIQSFILNINLEKERDDEGRRH
ncbi:F-box/LRR-repeat protein [Senna tora]|uniref:F-box/LRR-repeat protein n=1 Tax=Senna tora TaxID=362788 RepID=A0A834XGC2_9FABA|nr:F-box/LRR-repeat protein [Senna tora]